MSREEDQERNDYAIRGERIMRQPRTLPVYGGQANAMTAPLPAITDETARWLEEANQPDYRARVRAGLKWHKVSMAELARMCGCSPSNISAWLSDRYVGLGPVPKYIWRVADRYVEVQHAKHRAHPVVLAGREEKEASND